MKSLKDDGGQSERYRRFLEGGETPWDRFCDKKTPVGVIMITAVQRERRSIVARMAAGGSWEIGILEQHFRVSFTAPSPQPLSPTSELFQLLVPLAFCHPQNRRVLFPLLLHIFHSFFFRILQ